MARGPKATPDALKALKGNPGKRSAKRDASPVSVDVLVGKASAPSWLPEEAKRIWNQLAPELERAQLLKRPDALTFARYCKNFSLWLAAAEKLETEELVVTTSSEHVTMDRINKNLQVMLLIEKRLEALEDRFGLNPAERQKIMLQRAQGAGLGTGELPFDQPANPVRASLAKPAAPSSPVGFLN